MTTKRSKEQQYWDDGAQVMSAHTPGPWGLRSTGAVGSHGGADKGYMICLAGPHDSEGADTDEGRANARLIAAAPKMLELLREFTQVQRGHTDIEIRREARAILRDVEGESNV